MNKEKRIPTILGLLGLCGFIAVGVAFSNKTVTIGSKASGDCKPINPQITNITYNSFDVSFITTDQCLSNIVVDGKNIPDVRFVDTNIQPVASKVHYFQVNNLHSESAYKFNFISDGKTYDSSQYQTRTARQPGTQIPSSNLAWGRVFTPELKPAVDSIVYLNIPGASPLSSFVTSNGNWNISLAISFNDNKDNWFTSPANVEEDIVVISQDGRATQITGNTSHNNPVPDIVIGKNSFSAVSAIPDSDSISKLNNLPQSSTDKNLDIKNPSEGETISTFRPDFFGSAPVNSNLNIKVESDQEITDQTSSRSDGSWHWSPSENLAPGEHTITVSTTNPSTGAIESVSRKFIVLASDNNLAFSSSASANKTTPTSIPTTVLTSPTSTPRPTATLIPTRAPVNTSTPVVRADTSTESSMPVTGNILPTIISVTAAVVLIGISLVL